MCARSTFAHFSMPNVPKCIDYLLKANLIVILGHSGLWLIIGTAENRAMHQSVCRWNQTACKTHSMLSNMNQYGTFWGDKRASERVSPVYAELCGVLSTELHCTLLTSPYRHTTFEYNWSSCSWDLGTGNDPCMCAHALAPQQLWHMEIHRQVGAYMHEKFQRNRPSNYRVIVVITKTDTPSFCTWQVH